MVAAAAGLDSKDPEMEEEEEEEEEYSKDGNEVKRQAM